MSYWNLNYGVGGKNTNYQIDLPKDITEETPAKIEKKEENSEKKSISNEASLSMLDSQSAIAKGLLGVGKHKSLSGLNDAEFSKAVESLLNKYIDEDAVASITNSLEELATKLEEGKQFAMSEFGDISENSAEILSLAGIDAQA